MIREITSGPPARLAWSGALAAVCLIVLMTSVDAGFERVRSRPPLLPVPGDALQATIPLRNVARLAGSPVAVVLRLRAAGEPTAFTVALDGTTLTRVELPGGHERRVDAAGYLSSAPDHVLAISADRPGWQLRYVEVANVHGFSSGIVELVIVPRDRRARTPPWWLSLILAAGLLAPRPRLEWPAVAAARIAHRAAIALVLVLFAVAVLSPLFSPYRVLLSPATFVLLALVLYADPVTRLARRLSPPLWRGLRPRLSYLPHIAIILLVLWSAGQFYRPKTGFTSLIVFGGAFEASKLPVLRDVPHWVDPGAGYDGQFYAQLAVDPFLRSPSIQTALDSPAYRARRILMPWAAHLIGWGDPWRVLQAYALLNVGCWLALAWVLLNWLPPGEVRPTMAWAACLLGEGLLSSMRQSLPDGPGVLFLALAVLAIERNRRVTGSAWLSLAALTRETNLLGLVLLLPARLSRRSLTLTLFQVSIAIAPILLWSTYLWSLGFAPYEAGLRNFALPLSACLGKWLVTISDLHQAGWQSFARFSLLTLVAITTQLAFLAFHREWRSGWWRIGAVYALFTTVLGDAVWEGHPGAIGRVVVPMSVAFNVLLARLPWSLFLPLWVIGNANLLVGLDMMKVPWVSSP